MTTQTIAASPPVPQAGLPVPVGAICTPLGHAHSPAPGTDP